MAGELGAGAIFVVFGLALQVPATTATVSCTRVQGTSLTCELSQRAFFDWVTVWNRALPGLRSAEVKVLEPDERTKREHEHARDNHLVILNTREGSRRMNLIGDRLELVERVAAEINTFLEDDEATALRAVLPPAGIFRYFPWLGTGVLVFGLLYWSYVPVLMVRATRGRRQG